MESGNGVLFICKKKQRKKTTAAWKFTAVLPDELLQEIFLRLPNGRSLIRSTAVCRRWYSIVHKNPSFDNFVTRFMQHHANRDPHSDPSYVSDLFNFCPKFKLPVASYELRHDKSSLKLYDLSFIPNSKNLVIRASCGDLLLLSCGYWKYYICNSVTRNWFMLPELPRVELFQHPACIVLEGAFGSWGYSLVCHSPVSYSVVIVSNSYFNKIGEYKFYLVVFNSRTGIWTQDLISHQHQVPRKLLSCTVFSIVLQLVHTRQGVVHWLEGTYKQLYVLAAFEPLSSKLRLIPLPCGGAAFRGVDVPYYKDRVRLGVVRGRLRLLLMEEVNEVRFRVKIWELDDDDGWTLVHDLFLNVRDAAVYRLFFVLCLDPNDGDVIYLVRGKRISRYEIGQTKDVGICEFPCNGESMDEVRDSVARHLEVLTLVHPPWPTPISSLAKSTFRP